MPEDIEMDDETIFDEIRADIDTAIYAYATLLEIDLQMQSKSVQKDIAKAKNDCVFIICKGIQSLREGYGQEED